MTVRIADYSIQTPHVWMHRERVVPKVVADALIRWVETGSPSGHFVMAVIRNDLSEAIARADEASLEGLPAIMSWLYSEAPSACWGSHKKASEWQRYNGLQGVPQ